MYIKSSDDLINDRVGSTLDSKKVFNDLTKERKDEFYSDDIFSQAIEDETFDMDDIIDAKMYKASLLKALAYAYKYFCVAYPESLKYIEIFVLMNSIELPTEYSYLLEEKYNREENYEETFTYYGKLFNVSKQAVFERMNITFNLISKMANAFYNSSKNNIIKNLDIILSKFDIKDYSRLINNLSEDDIVFLMSDYMTYYTNTKYDYDKMCKIFNDSIIEKYFSIISERRLYEFVVKIDFENYPKTTEEVCVLRAIFNKPIFQQIFVTLPLREQSMVYNAFNKKVKLGYVSVETVMKFLDRYNKKMLKYRPKPRKKENISIEEVNLADDESLATVTEEIRRIKDAAQRLKRTIGMKTTNTIIEEVEEEISIENEPIIDQPIDIEKELEILKEAIKTYIIHNNYSYIVGLMETVKKELLIRYLDDLDEEGLFYLNLAYTKDTDFLNFNFSTREKIILDYMSRQPVFTNLLESLNDEEKSIINYLYTGQTNEFVKRKNKKHNLGEYTQIFIKFWNQYNAYFNEEYHKKHNK